MMAELKFLDNSYTVDDYDTVLNTLIKNGHAVPNCCRGGHCHSCLMKATEGIPMPFAQMGLDEKLVEEGYFLACQSMVYADMTVAIPDKDKRTRFTAMVSEKIHLTDDIVKIQLKSVRDFAYKSGQYITLRDINEDQDDYAIASIHLEDPLMEFHIQKGGNKALDKYIFEELEENDALEVQTSFTDQHYNDEDQSQTLVLIAKDIDVSGAIGLAREALHKKHTANIHLLHVRETLSSPYTSTIIDGVLANHKNIHYQDISTGDSLPIDQLQAYTDKIEDLNKTQFFLWGFNDNEEAAISKLATEQVILMQPY